VETNPASIERYPPITWRDLVAERRASPHRGVDGGRRSAEQSVSQSVSRYLTIAAPPSSIVFFISRSVQRRQAIPSLCLRPPISQPRHLHLCSPFLHSQLPLLCFQASQADDQLILPSPISQPARHPPCVPSSVYLSCRCWHHRHQPSAPRPSMRALLRSSQPPTPRPCPTPTLSSSRSTSPRTLPTTTTAG
jgi:hypothetical protein